MEGKHKVSFYYETDFSLQNEAAQASKVRLFLTREKRVGGCIQYIFLTDEQLYELNRKYLDHDTYTDILTFDMSESDEVAGDLYISIDRVKDNAAERNISWEEELDRVMVHGLLHLIGYGDKTHDEQMEMRSKEEEYLKVFSAMS
jgi:rRNA maturation RNase YbeY